MARGIPSSIKWDNGGIDYRVVAVVKRGGHKEEKIDREIEVLSPIRENLKV